MRCDREAARPPTHEEVCTVLDKVAAKAGNYVFINAHAVGLSSKLSAFEQLAVRMTHYESTLAKLTGSLSTQKTAAKKDVVVPPPEWPGN